MRGHTGRRHRLLFVLGAAGVLAVGLLTAPAAGAGSGDSTGAGPAWGACPDDVAGGDTALECTTVSVPLDHAEPDGERIDIAVSRLPSTEPGSRRGVLLMNPGGPGGSGLPMPIHTGATMPASVRARYDLIGFDPRGVGHSGQVTCDINAPADRRAALQPPYAHDDAEVAEHARLAERIATRCGRNERTLQHISTANTARDMDRIREALGEARISYFGVSYGSVLGTAYASMYPRRSDRFVLDSAIGTAVMTPPSLRRQGLGVEQTFPDFAAWVADRHATYGLGRTAAEVRRTYVDTAKRLREHPVDEATEDEFRLRVGIGSSDEAAFEPQAEYWRAVRAGESTPPPDAPTDEFLSSYLAVLCNDSPWTDDVGHYQRATRTDRVRYPLVGGSTANLMPCAYWPTAPEPPIRVDPEGPSNVLILQNLRDAATPYVGGRELRHRFGDRARLISADELGHGVYLRRGNSCADDATTAFLAEGTLPDHDLRCAAEPAG